MQKFNVHTGQAVALRRSNVDTDQIIPAVYLKRVARTGFEDALFASWRDDPEFVFNRPESASATILVAGEEFGTGSSREHAVWALQDWGFRAVIAPSFGDIFRNNALKGGLLTVELPHEATEQLWEVVESDSEHRITVDLLECLVRAAERSWSFTIDNFARQRLLEGLDDIALTLRRQGDIDSFEQGRAPWLPQTLQRA
ncbi:3-isopropylmalate dehydratase small subunit [Natronoglycomyces albus]|uniref:3-isopropylmalate dehydratase small subunit n=1 Tax=Natronoglycomyces albus TaxID=2811108 RepID=A0A895XUA3_9ACTN|nr:3-isopropylmalate dehydratase small subunit [Natronoglycomyces albus]QSB06106.1 3-isopropylmalate dehydratase small subunit [Natronoglycomyces albus]